jgi:hypothetical protein
MENPMGESSGEVLLARRRGKAERGVHLADFSINVSRHFEYPNGFFWLLRGGLTTKTGALVDALDNLIAFAPVSGRQAALPAFPRSGVLAGVVASLVSRITRARPLFE